MILLTPHRPLVREKLDLEQEAMDRIEQAQMDVSIGK